MDFALLVEQCEQALRDGKSADVEALMANVNSAQIPKAFRLPLAAVCRRAYLLRTGMRILAPSVRGDAANSTPGERAEYATMLMRMGALQEALKLLDTVESKDVLEVTMFRAFGHMVRWEYDQAVPLLREYLKKPANDYSAAVAKVNLASSLVSCGRHAEALEVLEANIIEARAQNHTRLLANNLELRGQVYLLENRFEECERDLKEAAQLLSNEKSSDQLFILKWQAILEGTRTGSLEPIRRVRAEAEKRGHWECVRDCDMHSLRIQFDSATYKHLMFGTQYASFRARLARFVSQKEECSYYLHGDGNGPVFDLERGTINGIETLHSGGKLHRLLGILTRDFYKPASAGAIFAELFPGEYYDPASSMARMHQVLNRTRQWAQKNGFPIEIEEVSGAYRLKFTGAAAFILPLRRDPIDPRVAIQLRRLSERFPGRRPFNRHQVVESLGISESTFLRLVTWGLDTDRLERVGNGRGTFYRLK